MRLSHVRALQFMLTHPLARGRRLGVLARYLRWQIGSRILGHPAVMPYIGRTRLLVTTGMHGATMNLYLGLADFQDMSFMLHMLRPADTFFDIGANVGVYSILASGVADARTVAVEPVPSSFDILVDNIALNRLAGRISAQNCGLAAQEGKLRFSTANGPTNHVLIDSLSEGSVAVPVMTLDTLAKQQKPVLLKIDVEGFEHEVIRGGRELLSDPAVLALIVELNGLGRRYGFDDGLIDAEIRRLGFQPATYAPLNRDLVLNDERNATGNTLYVRRSADLMDRLRGGQSIDVFGVHL